MGQLMEMLYTHGFWAGFAGGAVTSCLLILAWAYGAEREDV